MNLNNLVSVLKEEGKLQPTGRVGFADQPDKERAFSVEQTRNTASIGELNLSTVSQRNLPSSSGLGSLGQDPFKNLKQVMNQVDPYGNLNN